MAKSGTKAEFGTAGYLQFGAGLMQMWGMLEAGRMARINAERAKVQSQFAAQQAERQAGLVTAISQAQAVEEGRKGRYEASRALAVAAASSGGVSDPTMVRVLANVKGESVYRAHVALYEGAAKARQLRLDAAAGRLSGSYALEEGALTEQNYAIAALGKGMETGASLYAKYGGSGPGTGRGDSATIGTVDASNRM